MKKIYLSITAALILIACDSENNNSKNEDLELNNEFIEHHNALNSLDYFGLYEGYEYEDGYDSIKVYIEINSENNFAKKTVYFVGESVDGEKCEGNYVWSDAGNKINLDCNKTSFFYFVGENILVPISDFNHQPESFNNSKINLRKVN